MCGLMLRMREICFGWSRGWISGEFGKKQGGLEGVHGVGSCGSFVYMSALANLIVVTTLLPLYELLSL